MKRLIIDPAMICTAVRRMFTTVPARSGAILIGSHSWQSVEKYRKTQRNNRPALLALRLGLLLSLVATVSVSRGSADARVRMVHGRPQLFINGKRTPPLMLFVNTDGVNISRRRNLREVADEIKLASANGIRIVSFPMPGKLSVTPLRSQYRKLDRLFAFILKNDPKAYLIPRVWCGVQGFRRAYPAQQISYANGSHPMSSLASDRWYTAVKKGLIDLIRHINASRFAGRVIGYHLTHGNTGEWFTPDYWQHPGFDYSAPNRLGFARWLERHYHTAAALRAAWHDPTVTFQTVAIPPAGPAAAYPFYRPNERRYVDYLRYQNDMTARRVEQLAAVVKRQTAGHSLVITFFGYDFETPTPESANHALGRLLRDPNVDGIASPVSYGDRQPGGSPAFMGPVDSATLHGKLWILEDDTRTFLAPRNTGHCANLSQTVAVHDRNFGQMMIHRLGTWWMDLFGTGWLNNAGIWKDIGRLRAAYTRYAPKAQFEPNVAVIYDTRSSYYARVGERGFLPLLPALVSHPIQFFHCGTSVGFYLLSDIQEPNFPNAKVIIFLNAWRVNAATRRVIRRKLERNGRTLIWIYGDGFIRNGKVDTAAAGRLIGMRLRLRAAAGNLAASEITAGNALHLPAEDIAGLKGADAPSWMVADPAAIPLARYRNTQEVSIALQRFQGYQSLFIGDPRPSAAFWRALFPHLGVPVYLDTNDAFQTDGRLMMISSDGVAGPRLLTLPRRSAIYDILNGKKLAANVRHYRLRLGRYQTRLLRVVPAGRK